MVLAVGVWTYMDGGGWYIRNRFREKCVVSLWRRFFYADCLVIRRGIFGQHSSCNDTYGRGTCFFSSRFGGFARRLLYMGAKITRIFSSECGVYGYGGGGRQSRNHLLAMVSTRFQKILFIALILSLPICAFLFYQGQYPAIFRVVDPESIVAIFNEQVPLRVRVVENAADRVHGLSGQKSLEPTEGMLFVFATDDYHGIWMKDMLFPIDIAWIDAQGRVVSIERNVRPETFPKVFEPVRPVRYVIEANAHFMDSFNVSEGVYVTIPGYLEKK